MKKYLKPEVKEEKVVFEDIMNASQPYDNSGDIGPEPIIPNLFG